MLRPSKQKKRKQQENKATTSIAEKQSTQPLVTKKTEVNKQPKEKRKRKEADKKQQVATETKKYTVSGCLLTCTLWLVYIITASVLINHGLVMYERGRLDSEEFKGEFVRTRTGKELYVRCFGEGKQPVMLVHGAALSSLMLMGLAHRISQFTRVCVYDRPGAGFSYRATNTPLTSFADELVDVLNGTTLVKGPYVFVGYSLGGLVVHTLAEQYPEMVAGLLLLDPAPEDVNKQPAFVEFANQVNRVFNIMRYTAYLGVNRILLALDKYPMPLYKRLNEPYRSLEKAALNSGEYFAYFANEFNAANVQALVEYKREKRSHSPTHQLPVDVPVTAMLAFKFSDDVPQEVNNAWGLLQTNNDLVKIGMRAQRVELRGMDHYFVFTRPELVIDQLQRMLEYIARPKPTTVYVNKH